MKRTLIFLICLMLVLSQIPTAALASESGLSLSGAGGSSFIDQEYESGAEAEEVALNTEVSVKVMRGEWDGGEFVEDHNPYTNHFKITLPADGYITCENDCGLELYDPSDEEEPVAVLAGWKLGLAAGTYYLKGDFTYCETGKFTIFYTEANDWEKEWNNKVDSANEIARGQVMNGWKEDWESDFYRFTLPEAGRVSFGLTFRNEQTDLDKYWYVELGDEPSDYGGFGGGPLTLLDGDGGKVSEGSGEEMKTILVEDVGLAPGTYYLTLGAVSNFGAKDWEYQIFWDYVPDACCETERNDTYETADALPLNQPFFAEKTFAQPMHARRDDEDSFTFTLDRPGVISVAVNRDGELREDEEESRYSFVLEDREDHAIFESDLKWQPKTWITTGQLGLPAGTYYLSPRVPENIPYYIRVSYEATDGWEKEVNDEPETATAILPGAPLRGYAEADDWYTFTLTEPGTIDAGLRYDDHDDEDNRERHWDLTLYDARKEDIDTVSGDCASDSETKEGCSFGRLELSAGTYYLKVSHASFGETADKYYEIFLKLQTGEEPVEPPVREPEELFLNEEKTVSSENGEEVILKFSPARALMYRFSYAGSEDKVLVEVREEDGTVIGKKTSVYGEPGRYYRYCAMEANRTYYLHLEKENKEPFSVILLATMEWVPVTLDANGGYFDLVKDHISSQVGDHTSVGGTYTFPSAKPKHNDPTLEFAGWFTEAEGGEPFDENQKLYETTTIYAHWKTKEPDVHEHRPGTPVRENETAAACETAGGFDEVTYCEDCGEELSRVYVPLDALGHDYRVVEGTGAAASCETAGKEADQRCSRCEAEIKGKVIAATGHSWGAWVTTKEATETEPGLRVRTCQNDPSHTETEVIPVKGQKIPYGYAEVPDDPERILIGDSKTVTLSVEGEVATLKFLPDADGIYQVMVYGDSEFCVFSAEKLIDARNGRSAMGSTSSCFYAEAGKPCYFQIQLADPENAGKFTVSLERFEDFEEGPGLSVGEKEYVAYDEQEGGYSLLSGLPAGMSYDIDSQTLTLTNCRLDLSDQPEAPGYLSASGNLNLVLNGDNFFTGLSGSAANVYYIKGISASGKLRISGSGSLTMDLSGVKDHTMGIAASGALDIDGTTLIINGHQEPASSGFYGISIGNTWDNCCVYKNTTGRGIFHIRIKNTNLQISNTASNTFVGEGGKIVRFINIGIDSQDTDLIIENSDVRMTMTGGRTWGIGSGLLDDLYDMNYYGGRLTIDDRSDVMIKLLDTNPEAVEKGEIYALYFWENDIQSKYIYTAKPGKEAKQIDKNAFGTDEYGRFECKDSFVEFSPAAKTYENPVIPGDPGAYNPGSQDTPAPGHTHQMKKTDAGKATCTTAGNTAYWTCEGCGKFFLDEEGTKETEKDSWILPALGHDYQEVPGSAIAPTVEADGKQADRKCSRCGAVLTGAGIAKLPNDVSKAVLSGIKTRTYTGSKLKQSGLAVRLNGVLLENGTDYTAVYTNNINKGTAKVTVRGIGKYTGSISKSFTIKARAVTPTVTLSKTAYTYTGTAKKPQVTVTAGKKQLTETTDYTVTWPAGRKAAGIYTVKVTLKGNYSGSNTADFKIKKAANTVSKVTPASKTLKYSALKKKAQTIQLKAAVKFGTKAAFARDASTGEKAKKYITVSKTGLVTVKKGTPKNKYTVKVKVTSGKSSSYTAKSAVKTITITVG